MSLYNIVNPASMVAGQPEDVSQVLANFQAIQAVLNGGIDDSNINATGAISPSKLAGYPNDATKALFGNGTWKAALDLTNNGLQVMANGGSFSTGPVLGGFTGSQTIGTLLNGGGAGTIRNFGSLATDGALTAGITTDTQPRFQFTVAGLMSWGPGNAAVDTNLYRGAAGQLKTDNTFVANVLSTGPGAVTPGAGGIAGTSIINNGYIMSSAATANTGGLFMTVPADTQWRFTIDHNGLLTWGTGAAAGDTQVRRSGVNQLDLYTTSYGTWRAAAFTVLSDRETKKTIKEFKKPPVEKLLAAKIYTYRRDKTPDRHLGLMADELPEEVVVSGPVLDGDGEVAQDSMDFVDLYKLTTMLVATAQHLDQRLAKLEGAS